MPLVSSSAHPPAGSGRPSTPLRGPLQRATFVERPNRFLLRVRVEGVAEIEEAHLPDPGRLKELLIPGVELWVRPATGANRRTRWTAVLVRSPDGAELISLDTSLPNRLIGRALGLGALEEFASYELERAEWPHGRSRFDFLLTGTTGTKLVLEVKSVTLVEGGLALFPDAVTARGARHVRELSEFAGKEGWEAAVLFVVQRSDAEQIVAARDIDPEFADALEEAARAGVRLLGRRCSVGLEAVELLGPLPVSVGLRPES